MFGPAKEKKRNFAILVAMPCPMSCRFVKYESRYDFRGNMTIKLPRPGTDMIKKACSCKSIVNFDFEIQIVSGGLLTSCLGQWYQTSFAEFAWVF